jgi:hypothetical protein
VSFLDPVYQRPHDLVLGVLRQEMTHPLRVLRRRNWRGGDYTLRFQIIGESHVVRVERAGVLCFQEVLACLPLAPEQCAYMQTFSDLQAHRYAQDDYGVAVTFARGASAGDVMDARRAGFEVRFRMMHGVIPVTRIEWQRDGDWLRWWTLHTYPDAEAVTSVYSASHLYIGSH